MNSVLRPLLLLWLALAWAPAQAAITCTSITSPGISINYVANTTASVQGSFTVSCTRTSAADPTSVSYSVKADNGGQPAGVNNRARHAGGATLRYDLYTSAACATHWKGNVTIDDTITWAPGATGTITRQGSFWACITTAQAPAASGPYTDSVMLSVSYGGNNATAFTGTVPVALYAPAVCTLVTAAGDLTLPYVAFGPQVTRSTTFAVTCTQGMPYTMATDVQEGVLSGVRYVLGLSAGAANGTGAPQSHSVSATAPAAQAGSCPSGTCSATRTHTLTITY